LKDASEQSEEEKGDDVKDGEQQYPTPSTSGWKAPTTEEALTIKNSEVFKSNAFRLQVSVNKF
jgi:hypothetical protein